MDWHQPLNGRSVFYNYNNASGFKSKVYPSTLIQQSLQSASMTSKTTGWTLLLINKSKTIMCWKQISLHSHCGFPEYLQHLTAKEGCYVDSSPTFYVPFQIDGGCGRTETLKTDAKKRSHFGQSPPFREKVSIFQNLGQTDWFKSFPNVMVAGRVPPHLFPHSRLSLKNTYIWINFILLKLLTRYILYSWCQ